VRQIYGLLDESAIRNSRIGGYFLNLFGSFNKIVNLLVTDTVLFYKKNELIEVLEVLKRN